MGKIELVNGVVINYDNDSNPQSIRDLVDLFTKDLKAEHADNPWGYEEKYESQIELFRKEIYEGFTHHD